MTDETEYEDEELDEEDNVIFEISQGGFPSRIDMATITKDGERLRLTIRSGNVAPDDGYDEDCYITEGDLQQIKQKFDKLDWDEEYSPGYPVTDGDIWCIRYLDKRHEGQNIYPKNYKRKMNAFWKLLLSFTEKHPKINRSFRQQ